MKKEQLREIKIIKNFTENPMGSVLIESGKTKVFCTATYEDKVPVFLKNKGLGFITAEYAMLPSSTEKRKQRERNKVDSRSLEIQRLIGRSLRNVVDLSKLGERTIWIDCDVIQADGGTRTASITGGFVALCLALKDMYDKKIIKEFPINNYLAAISVGIVGKDNILDLCFLEDSNASVDMNVVMNDMEEFVEIQGTGEKISFSKSKLDELLNLASNGIKDIILKEKEVLGEDIDKLILENEKKKYNLPDTESKVNISKKEILVATTNEHKLEEIRDILSKFNFTVKSLKDYNLENIEVDETGETFEENAILKAKEFNKRTGKMVIADDSGLMVDYLKGAPGVKSRRFTNEEPRDLKNNEKLLKLLRGTISDERTASFVSCICLCLETGETKTFTGVTKGQIGFSMKGENGFGYDPLFIPFDKEAKGKTYAQISKETKNKISHRGRALRKLEEFLKEN